MHPEATHPPPITFPILAPYLHRGPSQHLPPASVAASRRRCQQVQTAPAADTQGPRLRAGRGLCQAAWSRAAPALGQSSPKPRGAGASPETAGAGAQRQPWHHKQKETADSGHWRAWGQQTWARIHAAGSPWGTQGLPGHCPVPAHTRTGPQITQLGACPVHCPGTLQHPTPHPCLRLHSPAQGLPAQHTP